MIIDSSALEKIKEIIIDENQPDTKLRVFVQGGGCSGFQYGFALDQEPQQEDDFEFNEDGVKILVDSMSFQYLQGATIRYSDDLMSAGFSIDNPNAQSTCGCGSSFSV